MWIFYAVASAIFAGVTSILVKMGVKNIDSNVATALRTIVVAIFAWIMVGIVGSQSMMNQISGSTLLFLILSGFATGASWLCYFKALQLGDINKVVPIDKSSTVLTMLLAYLLLGEELNVIKVISMALIGAGTYFMIEKKETVKIEVRSNKWMFYAVLSALFASLTAILGKVGIRGVESNLGTAIRTMVVLLMAWFIVLIQKKQREIKIIDHQSWIFIGLSGIATGLSWLAYYRALQEGPASVVVPIDKLSILITVFFGYFIFKEKLTRKSLIGLILIAAGTLLLLV